MQGSFSNLTHLPPFIFIGLEWSGDLESHQLKSESEVTQSCQTLCNPMDCRLPGSSIHETFQARVLEWVAFSRGSSQPRDQTWVSHVSGRLFTIWATREAQLEVKMFKRENPFFTPRTLENFLGHYFLMTHAEIQITALVKLDTVTLWSVSLYINTCSRGTVKGWETARRGWETACHNVTNRGPEMLAGILLQSLRRITFTQFSKCKEWLEGQKIADNRTLKPSHSMPKGWGEKGSATFESREKTLQLDTAVLPPLGNPRLCTSLCSHSTHPGAEFLMGHLPGDLVEMI